MEFFESNDIVPTSMIDVSDGLSSEILHICKQSELGCVLYEEKIPVSEETKNAAFKFEIDPTACALSGGEDYELLFTIHQSDYEKLVVEVAGLVPELESALRSGKLGPHVRRVRIRR